MAVTRLCRQFLAETKMAAEPATMLSLSISCQQLKNLDVGSKSDPCCVLFVKEDGCLNWVEASRTEVLRDTLNPRFVTGLKMRYAFERVQPVKFSIYDWDTTSTRLDQQELIGECETTLGFIAGRHVMRYPLAPPPSPDRPAMTAVFPLGAVGHPTGRGMLTVGVEESRCASVARVSLRAEHLDKKDFFGKSDPFCILSRLVGGRPVPAFKTEVINKTLDPVRVDRTLAHIRPPLCLEPCPDEPFLAEVFDFDKNAAGGFSVPLIHEAPPEEGPPVQQLGVLVFRWEVVRLPTFLDYILGGCEVSLIAAIDFTASNRLGSIVAPYDSDGAFPPEVIGLQGMLAAYGNAIAQTELYGPTNFAPQQQKYFVLLIITDGEITDLDQTISAIVRASQLPLSVIIVGVGSASFSNMKALDSDEALLADASGKRCVRDIVQPQPQPQPPPSDRVGPVGRPSLWWLLQFVAMRDCPNLSKLAAETLGELPRQLLEYMKFRGFVPNPPRSAQVQAPAPTVAVQTPAITITVAPQPATAESALSQQVAVMTVSAPAPPSAPVQSQAAMPMPMSMPMPM
ncbi:putative Nicotinic receptor-associated protein 1 [Paratrimastix pyriformis]|uniref:Nicotinic receptor-associated protein 1 n=1 Tax=Paratrimastix pyriformis TaxID=342808 RepID=A0ABQ8ULT5_9EUKA|nr:putative Nicotinic receptor-associated protein 1 [Paratrimastix pyriformis]